MHLSSAHCWVLYSASLSLQVNPSPHRYQYPVYPSRGEHQSSLIQVVGFSERPFIVPPEVLEWPQRWCPGSLAEKGKSLNLF